MPTKFALKFTGLCGIVPRLDITQTANQATVLLVDATAPPSGMSGMSMNPPHEPHVPILLCDAGSVRTGTGLRTPDLTFPDGLQQMAVFYLWDQEISIVGAAPDALTFKNDSTTGQRCPAGLPPADGAPCNWIAQLSTINPQPSGHVGAGAVRAACLDQYPNVDNAVLARARLTEGTIVTREFAPDSSKVVVNWDFQDLSGGPPMNRPQALAELVELSLDLGAASTVDLRTAVCRDSQYQRIANLFLGGPLIIGLTSGTGLIEATVKNVPWADVLGMRPIPPAGQRLIDDHFDHFYDLAVNPPSRNVPRPNWRCSGLVNPGPANPQCPPSLFEPHPNA
ncbi:MAG TPA: hypothetical protein VH988_14075 [Thermoanaerobaculia bacterium]|jgi:hypothetical protein|nr:hypothetical protein [Thermoanaerobaculia bacterium]